MMTGSTVRPIVFIILMFFPIFLHTYIHTYINKSRIWCLYVQTIKIDIKQLVNTLKTHNHKFYINPYRLKRK